MARPYFTIPQLAAISGIKANVLRTWLKRYPLLEAAPEAGVAHRYGHGVLKKLIRIALLHQHDVAVETIAAYTAQQLDDAALLPIKPRLHQVYLQLQLLREALDLNRNGFDIWLDKSIEELGFELAIEQVCYPLLQKMELVVKHQPTLAAMHLFCSHFIVQKISTHTARLPVPPHAAPEIILFSPHSQPHELRLHYINYLLRSGGWATLFIGADVKQATLQPFVHAQHITHVFAYIRSDFTGVGVGDYLADLCKLFETKTVVVAGKGVRNVQRNFVNLTWLKTDDAIRVFAQKPTLTLV